MIFRKRHAAQLDRLEAELVAVRAAVRAIDQETGITVAHLLARVKAAVVAVEALRQVIEAMAERRIVVGPPPPDRRSVNLEVPLLSPDQALEVAEKLREAAHLMQGRIASERAA